MLSVTGVIKFRVEVSDYGSLGTTVIVLPFVFSKSRLT